MNANDSDLVRFGSHGVMYSRQRCFISMLEARKPWMHSSRNSRVRWGSLTARRSLTLLMKIVLFDGIHRPTTCIIRTDIKVKVKVKNVDLGQWSGDLPPLMCSGHWTRAAGQPGHCPQPAHTGLGSDLTIGRQRQSAVGLHLRNPSLMDYYSFNRPRRDGRLSEPCWLTDSGRFTHKVVTRPAVSLAQG